MRIKSFAVSALAAAVLVGCATQQSTSEQKEMSKAPPPPAASMKPMEAKGAAPAKKTPAPKPKTLVGASGAMLASTCEGCHGTDGISNGPATPTIGGMSEDYLIEAMEEFQSGDNHVTIMGRVAKGYNSDEIAAMSEYFSNIEYKGAAQTANASDIAKGKALHDEYCEKCHSDGGRSADDDSSVLAGQWAPYLHYTMADFMNGDRNIGRKMKKKVDELLEKEGRAGLNALISYYASQK